MKLDAYSHILPPSYFEEMKRHVTNPAALKRWLELPALHDVEARLTMMEEFGPEYQQVLTLSSPPIEALAAPEVTPALARLANEEMAALCAEHPDRFPWFVAALPLNNVEASLRELTFAVDELGAVGFQVFTNVNGLPLDHPDFEPLFTEADRRSLPIWMHPTRSADVADYRTETRSEYEVWWALGWPYETSAAMARMVFSGLFDRYPNVSVITHHLGAMIPYLEGRIRLGWADQFGSRTADVSTAPSLKRPLIDYFRDFYADTALSGSEIGTRCGLAFFGARRTIFGTDCPFDPEGGPMYVRETIRIIDGLKISEEDRQAIYWVNLTNLIRSSRWGGHGYTDRRRPLSATT